MLQIRYESFIINLIWQDHDEQNKKFLGKINRQIENLAKDLSNELSKQDASLFLQNFIQEDLPKLREDLNHEIITRKDMENKIYEEFSGQLSEINQIYEQEKKERESKTQEFMQLFSRFSDNISEDISNSREERYFKNQHNFNLFREKNSEMLLKLVENVVSRIQKEAVEVFH